MDTGQLHIYCKIHCNVHPWAHAEHSYFNAYVDSAYGRPSDSKMTINFWDK